MRFFHLITTKDKFNCKSSEVRPYLIELNLFCSNSTTCWPVSRSSRSLWCARTRGSASCPGVRSKGTSIVCCLWLTYRQNTWNDVRCPTKWRESSLRQTLQVRVTSDTQNIPSSGWPKHRHKKFICLWAQITLYVMHQQHQISPFVRHNVISEGPTNGLSIRQLRLLKLYKKMNLRNVYNKYFELVHWKIGFKHPVSSSDALLLQVRSITTRGRIHKVPKR